MPASCQTIDAGYRLSNEKFDAIISVRGLIGIVHVASRGEPARESIDVQELPLTLRLGTGAKRIDFTDWQFHAGSGHTIAPEDDWGYALELHRKPTDNGAGPRAQRLTDTLLGPPFYTDIYYPGFCWYRRMVELPREWQGKPIVFVLGGHDEYDWRDYWVYLNGERVGHSSYDPTYVGPWHEAPRYVISPESTDYKRLKFGGANLLSIQARTLDRRTATMHRYDLERYSGASMLVDQYVSGGEPTREVSSFIVADHRSGASDREAWVEIDLAHPSKEISAMARYWLSDEDAAICKRLSVRNESSRSIELLEADVMSLKLKRAQASGGGQGWPVRIGADWFGAVAHPAGVAQWTCEKEGPFSVRLRVIPGATLDPMHRHDYVSKTAVVGVGNGARAFADYLQAHGRRKPEFLKLYSLYGLCEIASSLNPTIELTESLVAKNLDRMKDLQSRGIKFDYYCIDTGWNDPLGDLKEFHPKNFPHGGEATLKNVRDLGMKPLLWMSPAQGPPAFRFGVTNPLLKPEDNIGAFWFLCVAAPRWRDMLRDAMLHHVKKNGVRGFKLDEVSFYCARPTHGHLPNKYGIEFEMDAFIDTLDAVKRECPDVLFMLYWRFMSPWWLLHVDTIYQRGLSMEGATPSDTPSRLMRQSVTIGLDQGHDLNWNTMPLIGQDSLGVWLSNTRWGSWMGAEGWRDAWVMDFVRGNMMHQLWGDLSLLNEADLNFLGMIDSFTAWNKKFLARPIRILGSPWKGEPYGYACCAGDEGFIAVHNGQFAQATVDLMLNESIGLCGDESYEVKTFYRRDSKTFAYEMHNPTLVRAGELLRMELSGFEVFLAQIGRTAEKIATSEASSNGATTRVAMTRFELLRRARLSWNDPSAAAKLARVVNGRTTPTNSPNALQASPDRSDERDREIVEEKLSSRAAIRATEDVTALVVVAKFDRDGIAWHHLAPHLIVQVEAKAKNQALKLTKTTPHRMHEQAGAWSWVTHEFEVPAGVSDVELSVNVVHPADVNVSLEVWHCEA